MFHLIPYLNKTPDKIIIHICTNDGLSSNKTTIYMTIKKIKKLIKTHHPDCKNIFIFFPILRADNKKAANILKSNIINILKREKHNVILRWNFSLDARCLLDFAHCSLLFTRCSLLFARCLLLLVRCSLLFARCSLFFTRCSLLLLDTQQEILKDLFWVNRKIHYPFKWIQLNGNVKIG